MSSTSPLKGFSILQPTIGAPLSWMPAVGTLELEKLINAYLPGPGSAQEKRAALSIDFFEYSARTGESFKYYHVSPAVASSPATSSSFASPAISDLTYSGSSTPAPHMARTASRRSPAKPETTDSSHLPGMKILTIDGEDVTNSTSRGCKTKEQREHAHLMRVLKACDACKRKKIRCDPSHKRRTSSQAKSETITKPAAKKAKKSPLTAASQAAAVTPAPDVSLDMDMDAFATFPADGPFWDEFLTFNEDATIPVSQDFYGAVPQDFDFYFGQETQFSPAISGSSGSFDSPAQPLTPDNSHVLPQVDFTTFTGDNTLAFTQAGGQQPVLPYMATGGAHGSNYVDFNLYSPASSYIDEEPQKLKAGGKRKASSLQTDQSAGSSAMSPSSLNESLVSTGLAHDHQWRFDHSGFASPTTQVLESRVHDARDVVISGQLGSGSASLGSQSPFHADDAGQGRARAVTTTRSNSRPVQQSVSGGNSLATPAVPLEGSERNVLLPQGVGLGTPATTTASSPLSSRVLSPQTVQQDIIPVVGNAQGSSRTVSPAVLQAAETCRLRSSQRSSISSTPLPLSTAIVPTSLDRQTERSLRGGLLTAGELLPAGGLCGPLSSNATANNSSLATPVVVATRGIAVEHVSDSVSGSGSSSGPIQVLRRPGEASANGSTAAVARSSSSTLDSRLSPWATSHGQQRQLLHGATILASAASSSPQRLLSSGDAAGPTHSPVRQLLGRSASPAQLVAFGLVSMLLIVAITSQLQGHSPATIAHLLSSNSSMIIFSLLSMLLSKEYASSSLPAAPAGKSSLGHALDNTRSLFSHSRVAAPCRDRSNWIGPARVPVACF